MNHRGLLLWLIILGAFAVAVYMLYQKLSFDLATFLSTIMGLLGMDSLHQHVGTYLNGKSDADVDNK